MKSLLWFVFGLAGGFVVAHFVNKDPRGREALADLDARISEFTDRITSAYREQEARISGAGEAIGDAAAEAVDAVKDAASDVIDAAKNAD